MHATRQENFMGFVEVGETNAGIQQKSDFISAFVTITSNSVRCLPPGRVVLENHVVLAKPRKSAGSRLDS